MVICPEVTHSRANDGIKQITVDEIQEAMRRHSANFRPAIGLYRSELNLSSTIPYLAL